jgi:hypothetical protein
MDTDSILQLPPVELSIKMTEREINLWRLAMARAASEEETRKASKLLFRTLKERACRYTVRELGKDYNAVI